MATNFNVSPYYDDYSDDKLFHRILFRPAFAVQARELTQLQTILQNQVARFGQHMFKEGSVVIPGSVAYDDSYYAVKLESTFFGVPVESYFDKLVGLEIKGKSSGVTAVVQPAGSIRDKEIIKFANDTNTILIFSKTRHFRH